MVELGRKEKILESSQQVSVLKIYGSYFQLPLGYTVCYLFLGKKIDFFHTLFVHLTY